MRSDAGPGLPGGRTLSLLLPAGDVTHTAIGSLGLKVDDTFGYWFDFGDDGWHQINVVAIADEAPRGRYPRVIKRAGASPPQYADWEEEDKASFSRSSTTTPG